MACEHRGEWSAQKRGVFDSLAQEIREHYAHGRVIVAVDGQSGSGRAQFATALAESLQSTGAVVFDASMEDFRHPRSPHDGDAGDQGYDYSLLQRVLIDPYRTGGSTGFALQGFDASRNEPVFQPKWKSAGADATLIIHGALLHRPELAGVGNFSVWLESSVPVDDEKLGRRTADARVRATVTYDTSDREHPKRIFADTC